MPDATCEPGNGGRSPAVDASNVAPWAVWAVSATLVSGEHLAEVRANPWGTVAQLAEAFRKAGGLPARPRLARGTAVLAEGRTLLDAGLWDGATVVAVRLPTAPVIAAIHEEGTAAFWSCETGHCQRLITDLHQTGIRSAAFSPDGCFLAVGCVDGVVRLWSVVSGRCEHLLEGHTGLIASVAFSPQTERIASGSLDGTLRVWTVETGACEMTVGGKPGPGESAAGLAGDPPDPPGVSAVTFAGDGAQLAMGCDDGQVRLLRASSSDAGLQLLGHCGAVLSLAFTPNCLHLGTGSADGTVRIWCVHTGLCEQMLECRGSWVWSLAFSPDGASVAIGAGNGTARIWSMEDTRRRPHALICEGRWLYSVSFSPDGSLAATGDDDGGISLWSPNTGWRRRSLRAPLAPGSQRAVLAVAFLPRTCGLEERASEADQ